MDSFTEYRVVQIISRKTKQKSERVVLGLIVVSLIFLFFFSLGQKLLYCFFGFLYPAYRCIYSIHHQEHDEKRWLTYWIVFGFMVAFDSPMSVVLRNLPLEKVLISLLLFFIYCPLTNGYEYMYLFIIDRVTKLQDKIINKYFLIN